jgi:hypothetical protein
MQMLGIAANATMRHTLYLISAFLTCLPVLQLRLLLQ